MPLVCIIGGGPAGAVAAIALRQLGQPVLLVEQRRFPRDKVCGDCVSALGIQTLHALGIAPRIQSLGAIPLHRARLHTGTSALELPLAVPMWGISRRALDQELLNLAGEAGTEILQPTRCEAIIPGSPPTVRLCDLTTHDRREIQPDYVLLADGKGPATADMGVQAYFRESPAADAIDLFSCGGSYGGLAPIEAGLLNAAFSIPRRHIAESRGQLDALMDRVISANPVLAARLARAERIGHWLASPLPRGGVRDRWPQGIIPIGNAAAAVEPIGGEGMGLAMRSAHLAAMHLEDRDRLRRAYASLWRHRRWSCRAAALLLAHPRLARPIFQSLATPLAPYAMRFIGKPRLSPTRIALADR